MFNGGSLNPFVGASGWWEGENKSQGAGERSSDSVSFSLPRRRR